MGGLVSLAVKLRIGHLARPVFDGDGIRKAARLPFKDRGDWLLELRAVKGRKAAAGAKVDVGVH